MLRARRVFSAFLFATLVFSGATLVQAETYEVGPFTVFGVGDTMPEAEDDAFDEALDLVAAIEASLPAGHEIIDFVIEFEGPVTLFPPTYELKFHLVIEHELPGLPKGGPGQ